jgi:hypothetical protein
MAIKPNAGCIVNRAVLLYRGFPVLYIMGMVPALKLVKTFGLWVWDVMQNRKDNWEMSYNNLPAFSGDFQLHRCAVGAVLA